MICTTWLGEREYTAPVSDTELQKLLEQVRAATGEDYRLHEHIYTTGRLWWKKSGVYYEIYAGIRGHDGTVYEHQVLNFYRGSGESTLPGGWDCTAVSTFFYGTLNGKLLSARTKEGAQP